MSSGLRDSEPGTKDTPDIRRARMRAVAVSAARMVYPRLPPADDSPVRG